MMFINLFFIYSFLGFILECLYDILRRKKIQSGILYGPITPIYGFGSLLILFIYNKLINILNFNMYINLIIILIIISIVLTMLEFLGGKLIEKIFHKVFWDYKEFKFHIGHYIALEVSFMWMIGSLFIIYIINPFIMKFINMIPNFITYILIIIFIIDIIISITKKVK